MNRGGILLGIYFLGEVGESIASGGGRGLILHSTVPPSFTDGRDRRSARSGCGRDPSPFSVALSQAVPSNVLVHPERGQSCPRAAYR